MDQLDGVDPVTGQRRPIMAVWGSTGGDRSGTGLHVIRTPLRPGEATTAHGLPLTTAPRAAVDEMCHAASLEDAVIVVDAAAHARVLTLPGLMGRLETRPRRRGVRRARSAMALADQGSRSPWESRLRVVYVLEAGLPRPEVNLPIFDRRTGRLVGIADLIDLEAGHVSEFDGQQHRTRRQHNLDNRREEDLESLGLVVTRADSLDLIEGRADLVHRLRSGRARGLARDRSRDLWTVEEPPWWREEIGAADVVLTDAEKAQLFGGAD